MAAAQDKGRSALLIGWGLFLALVAGGRVPNLGWEGREKRNLFLQKVTFGFETKGKEQCTAHFMVQRTDY